METTSMTTLSSILDELDHAIAENMRGVVAAECESGSSEAAVFELRGFLQQKFNTDPTLNLDDIELQYNALPVPLPNWIPKQLTSALGWTKTVSASEALASVIQNPTGSITRGLTSAIEMATSVSSGSRANSRPVSEHAGPSGLTTADRNGNHERPSGPSSTTTLLIDQPVSHNTNSISPTNNTQHYKLSTPSRASSSAKNAARAQLELELARAKEERIQKEIEALNTSSRCSEADSLRQEADRLHILGGAEQQQARARNGTIRRGCRPLIRTRRCRGCTCCSANARTCTT